MIRHCLGASIGRSEAMLQTALDSREVRVRESTQGIVWVDPEYDERTGEVLSHTTSIEISEDDLTDWLSRNAPRAKPASSFRRAKCVEWLINLRREGEQSQKKGWYEAEAFSKFGVTDGQFQNVWDEAAKAYPSQGWGRAGAPKKNRVP
jgi:hypothetical protein